MPGAVRKSDVDSDGFSNKTSSPDTIINNISATRYGDKRKKGTDSGTTVKGAEIFINNRHMQYIGHPDGNTQIQGSPNVIGN